MEANILRILVLLIGVALVAIIMIQQPKEGGMGAFTGGGGGGGASSTVFGAKGSGNFLFRLTIGLILAFVIFIIVLVKVTNSDNGASVFSSAVVESEVIPGKKASTNADSIPGASTKPNVKNESIPGANAKKDVVPGAKTNNTESDTIPGAKQ